MTEAPLVSVLIPAFNAERWIAETLESALTQSWPRLEVIVVDDGSVDRSAGIVEGFASRSVKLIRQANAGPSAARNRAFAAARGDFIQWLDADDLLGPDKIERQMTRLSGAPDCAAVGEIGRFQGQPAEAQFAPWPGGGDRDALDWLTDPGRTALTPCWLVPRQIVLAAGPWNEALRYFEDVEYFTRVGLAARRILYCPDAVSLYRRGLASSQSRAPDWAQAFAAIDLAERAVRAREDSPRVRRYYATLWLGVANVALPEDGAVAENMVGRGRALADLSVPAPGGPRFQFVRRLIGWRLARRLQHRLRGL